MREEWKIIELGEICKIKGGKRLPSGHDFVEDKTDYLYIRARDIKLGKINIEQPVYINNETFKKIKGYTVFKDDVILTIAGTIGETALVNEKFHGANLTENAVRIIVDSVYLDACFLNLLFQTSFLKSYFDLIASGAAQPKLGIYKIQSTKILLPPLPTQRRIASILSAYDDLIENNLRRIALLEEMARQTYEEWFVRMRFPGWEETEWDGELPKGWEKVKLGEVVKTSSGGTPSRKMEEEYYSNGTIPWVRTGELRNFMLIESEEKITGAGLKNSSAKLFSENTVLLAMYGNTIGETSFLTFEASTNQACCAFLVEDKTYLSYFIHQYLLYNKEQVLSYRMGAAQENISQTIIQNIEIILPDVESLISFESNISLVYSQIKNLLQQNRFLSEARDILLPRLMSGVVEV